MPDFDKEEGFDLEGQLQWMEEAGTISEGFDSIYKSYWEDRTRFAPAISGIAFAARPKRPVTAYVPGFIYAGAIQAIVGPPKAGKSTFVWSMIVDLMEGKRFLGEETKLPGGVLYITEQGEYSFDMQLEKLPAEMKARILGNSKFFMMLPESHILKGPGGIEMNVTDWQTRLGLWKEAIEKTKADLFVIDTFNQYADLGNQGENDNAMIGRRILELRQLQKARPSLAILLICHTNKAGYRKRFLELNDIRGGSALAGGLDHGVTFQKTKAGNSRFLGVESRMLGDKKLVITWLSNGTYVNLTDWSIRDLAQELGISYRKARSIKLQAEGKEEDSTEEDDTPMPKFD